MRIMLTNNAPMSATAVFGACAVLPVSHARVASPAVASPLAARQLPTMRQEQFGRELILTPIDGYTPVKVTPSTPLGGFRGVPPRRRPV